MAHRADGLNDIFEHDVTVRKNLNTKGGTVSDTPAGDSSLVNKKYVDDQFPVTHASTTGQTTDDHHAQSHTIVSHSDTTATGAQLDTLTDNSIANTLHRHSELVASDGSPDPALSVDASGNVGIGTASPSGKFHVTKEGDPLIYFENTADNSGIRGITTNYKFSDGIGAGLMASRASGGDYTDVDLRFFTGGDLSFGQEKMRIDKGGNVGIGTTNPLDKLHIRPIAYGNSQDGGIQLSDTGDNWNFRIALKSDGIGNPRFGFDTEQNADAMVILNAGKVGIGTSSPAQKLNVIGNIQLANTEADNTQKLSNLVSSQYASGTETEGYSLLYGQSTSAANTIKIGGGNANFNAATEINFFTAATLTTRTGTERMTILKDGKVGIGTSSPSEELDVVGNIKASGYISGKKCGVFAYLASPANTTITTAGTYYPIAGTFTNAPIEDFTAVATPAIRYDGAKTQYFEIDWHASGYGDSNGQTIHIGIKKNGVLCTGGVMGTFLKFLGEEQALSGTCVIELATNDTIQLVITSDTNGDVITMEHFTTTITEFFD